MISNRRAFSPAEPPPESLNPCGIVTVENSHHGQRKPSHSPRGLRAHWSAAGYADSNGYVHGATDEFGYKLVEAVVSVHDFHATLLHTPGVDHHALNFPHEGRAASLTDPEVTGARIVPALLA